MSASSLPGRSLYREEPATVMLMFSKPSLRAAQENPEKYASLQVRVCGWNVFFNHLSRAEQDEFIRQAEHEEGIR